MAKTIARPIRLSAWSPDLRVYVRRVVAYRAECDCDWRGPSRPTIRQARADAAEHRAEGCSSASG